VVRAPNGDVIRYDPSGLVMRLSDKVIADIALGSARATRAAVRTPGPPMDEDALATSTPGTSGPRATGCASPRGWPVGRACAASGVMCRRAILGDAPGPVMAILGLGGPSAALATPGPPAYPHHVVAPADDIGAVGMAGIEAAPETDRLEGSANARMRRWWPRRCSTGGWRLSRPCPSSLSGPRRRPPPTAAALATGRAVENLRIAARNLAAAATSMGRKARIAAVCLDFALEDLSQTPWPIVTGCSR
jgi:hypothetical protein